MLTLQIVRYAEIEKLSSLGKIRKLLNLAKEDNMVLLEGRLKKEEEAELIKTTMEEIDNQFKGIEMAVIEDNSGHNIFDTAKHNIVRFLMGERTGFTIIGPATVVKQIKRDPNKIQVLMEESRKKKKKSVKRRR